jgi:protein-S-isoprenylcysteine O-methyltransferase Ste14
MRATLFEFRNRWWVFSFIFSAAFLAYAIDHQNSGVAIGNWLAGLLATKATPGSYRLVFALGSVLLVLAACIRTWGTSYLQAEVMRDARVHTERLLADGPYRYVRNPLYLGNILLAVGVGLMASRVGFLILSIGLTVFVMRLIFREESELQGDQGDSYRRYCAAVPRLLPSLTARVPPAGNAPRWGQAFRAEMMYWLLALAMAVYVLTLNLKPFWAVFAVAVAASWFLKPPGAPQKSVST